MDGTIRDLASLRGTYRLIDKTDTAILLIGNILKKSEIDKVVFLDKCLSWINLNAKIIEEINEDYPYVDFSKINIKE